MIQTTARHKVILSWRASAAADSKHASAVGYCIYRGTKHNDPSPELVNSIPFPGTTCADDQVESGKKYYYIVRAISANRVTSIVSNEAPAPIPSREPTSHSTRANAPPLCRESSGSK